MKEFLKDSYKYFKTIIFGSRLSYKIIFMHIIYNVIFIIKSFFKKKNLSLEVNNNLKNFLDKGYFKLENAIPDTLLNTLYSRFLEFIKNEKYLDANSAKNILRIKDCLIHIPEAKKILDQKEIKDFLSNYFKGEFKIYYCDIHRLCKEKNSIQKIDNSSLEWHFDNCPKKLIKLMIYLVDVTKENAAISLLNKKLSLKLKLKGYWDRKTQRNKSIISKYDIDNQSEYIEGRKKSGVFFSTHYCLHRANVPINDNVFRDAVVFLIGPSLTSYDSQINIEKDRILSDIENFSLKPF